MPDDRFFHKRAGHSEKVNRLTDIEELAWRYYIESADDFGVMRFAAVELQANYDRMASRSKKAVQKLLEAVHGVELVETFPHQGHIYCCQLDWQVWQKVKHPRKTINPKPPDAILARCDPSTRKLFLDWPGKSKEKLPQDFGNSSESFGNSFHLARAAGRETATAMANGLSANGERLKAENAELSKRAGAFAEWYAETHERIIGVAYISNPHKDYSAALEICKRLNDLEARDAALVWFGSDDDFARNGTRTIPKFASRASDCLLKARRVSA